MGMVSIGARASGGGADAARLGAVSFVLSQVTTGGRGSGVVGERAREVQPKRLHYLRSRSGKLNGGLRGFLRNMYASPMILAPSQKVR